MSQKLSAGACLAAGSSFCFSCCCRLCAGLGPSDVWWGCTNFTQHDQINRLHHTGLHVLLFVYLVNIIYTFSRTHATEFHIYSSQTIKTALENEDKENKNLVTKQSVIQVLNTEKTFKFFFFSFLLLFFFKFYLIFNHFWSRPLKLCSSDCAAYNIYSWCC